MTAAGHPDKTCPAMYACVCHCSAMWHSVASKALLAAASCRWPGFQSLLLLQSRHPIHRHQDCREPLRRPGRIELLVLCVCVCVSVCMCVVGKTRIGAGLTLPCHFCASRWNQRWCPHGLRRSHPQKMHLPRQRLQSCLMAVLPQRYSYRVVHSASVM